MVYITIPYVYCDYHCHLQIVSETGFVLRRKKESRTTHPPAVPPVLTQNQLWQISYWNNICLEIKEQLGRSGTRCIWLTEDQGSRVPLYTVGPLGRLGGLRAGLPPPAQILCLLFGVRRLSEHLFLCLSWRSCQTGDAPTTHQHSSGFCGSVVCFCLVWGFCLLLFFFPKTVSGSSWWLKADPRRSSSGLQEEPLLEAKSWASS